MGIRPYGTACEHADATVGSSIRFLYCEAGLGSFGAIRSLTSGKPLPKGYSDAGLSALLPAIRRRKYSAVPSFLLPPIPTPMPLWVSQCRI